MIRTSCLAILAVVALGGCVTDGYSYRGGRGDYYYGQPTIEYRHYGYGVPYGSLGYGYYDYGYGYPYGYYDYPYGYYGSGYYYVPRPQYPPAQPPPQDPDRADLSVKDWVETHGYPLNGSAAGGDTENEPFDDNRRRAQMATGGSRMRAASPSLPASRTSSNPDPRARVPTRPARDVVHLSQPATRTYAPPQPRTSTRQASPLRTPSMRPASRPASRSGSGDADEDVPTRMRRP